MKKNPDSIPVQPQHLFVYGSLRLSMSAHHAHLAGPWVRYTGPGRFRGRLLDTGAYPAAVPSPRRYEIVHGEVYRLLHPDSTLTRIDRYENGPHGEPPEFNRTIVQIAMKTGGHIPAWIYLYNLPTRGLDWIRNGDYVQYWHQRLKNRKTRI